MDGFDVAIYIGRGGAPKTTMANPSPVAQNAADTVPVSVGRALKAMPGGVAVRVASFLELAPGLANTPANIAKLQKFLKDGRPGRRDGSGIHKGYCRKVGRVSVRIFWKRPRWVFALHRAEKSMRGQTHVLVEEEKSPKDFLEGLMWLQERVTALRRFGFCKTCDKELPEIGMYCAECVITSIIVHTDVTDNAD